MNLSIKTAALWGALAGALLLPVLQVAAVMAFYRVFYGVSSTPMPALVAAAMQPGPLLMRVLPFAVPTGAVLGALTGATVWAYLRREPERLRALSRGAWLASLALLLLTLVMSALSALQVRALGFPSTDLLRFWLRTSLLGIVTNIPAFWAFALAVVSTVAANRMRHAQKREQAFAAATGDA